VANELQNYIDGSWVDAVDGERFDVFNPATGEVLATAPHSKQADADRAIDAAQKAIASPLLEETSIEGARGVLINITGGGDLTLHEVNEAASAVAEAADGEANIIVGAVVDDSLTDEIRVTVIATGFDDRRAAIAPLAPVGSAAPAASSAGGRTVDMKAFRGGERPSPWRRSRMEGVRADGMEPLADDLDIPAFLRRQAD